jgi:hypothetical protein
VFIPNGVNKPHLRKASIIKDKFGLDKDSYILFLGRLVPEKGIKYLIEAFKGVDTDKKLVIAGSSSDTDLFTKELKEMAKDDERIIFTGFVQGDELRELYSNAYLYTLPSDLEGMPLSLLEAMSYGNACLISDIDECTSVVEDHAFIFKRSDVHDLKDVLQSACNDTDKVNKLKKARPDIAITTDIIVAFPGETEEQFKHTLDLVDEVQYDGAYTFIFSPREGTPAYSYENTLTEDEKKNRLQTLIDKVNSYYHKGNERFVGTVQKVLVDGPSKNGDDMLCGYTPHNKLCHFKSTNKDLIGKIVDVKITEAFSWFVIGELCE